MSNQLLPKEEKKSRLGTVYDWILGVPVISDNTNYEWVLGTPYIIHESIGLSIPIAGYHYKQQ